MVQSHDQYRRTGRRRAHFQLPTSTSDFCLLPSNFHWYSGRVQLLLPLLTRRQAVPPVVRIGVHTYKVEIARHRRARRYVLRLADEADTVRLTVPRGASIAEGLRFAERQAAWIERER